MPGWTYQSDGSDQGLQKSQLETLMGTSRLRFFQALAGKGHVYRRRTSGLESYSIGCSQGYENMVFSWFDKCDVDEQGAVVVTPDRTIVYLSVVRSHVAMKEYTGRD